MSATATRITAEEYYAQTVVGDRKQLVEGEIVVNEPKLIHAMLQSRLLFALGAWARGGKGRGHACAPTDVGIDEHNVYGPDLLWFSRRARPDRPRRLSRMAPGPVRGDPLARHVAL